MNIFKHFLLFLFLMIFFSCSTEDISPQSVNGSSQMTFRVTNYYQHGFDDITRAASADKLAHLAFAVFDAETDSLISPVVIQDRGSEDYGTFTTSLSNGKYRLLFLGYDGDKSLILKSPNAVAFADDYVPHTFMYSSILNVDSLTSRNLNIVLQRVVAAFRLSLLDAIPSQVQCFRMHSDIGGTVLDVTNGLSNDSNGRTGYISIPTDKHEIPGLYLTYYLYMPSTEAKANLTLSALDSKGEIYKSRTFTQVPMALNRLTVFEGEFFTDEAFEMTNDITVDYDWNDTLTVRF